MISCLRSILPCRVSRSWLLGVLLLAMSCQQAERAEVPTEGTPKLLSGWHLLDVKDRALLPGQGVLPYDLNTPLFSDYAHKLRTVWMPDGRSADYRQTKHFDFPVGTVLTKTFYYPKRDGKLLRTASYQRDFKGEGLDLEAVHLIETRVLVKREAGWEALPYVWNDQQTRARLEITGDIKALSITDDRGDRSFNYVVPSKNECASCHAADHTSAKITPIGLKARHLNKPYQHYEEGAADQLAVWRDIGYLKNLPADVPAAARWEPGAYDDLEHRARSYLDINCGHCHNPAGPADTSGLFLHAGESRMRHLGVCKPPIAAGRGSGGRSVSIYPGKPSESMIISRMESTDPAEMMPELGRSLVHREGVSLVARWIESLEGECSSLRL